jgi:hypothetical protein
MRSNEIVLGMRVRRKSGEGSFVKDRTAAHLKGRRNGIIIGLPELISISHRAARVQWEGSTRSDDVLVHRLEALPQAQQPVALGGQWAPDETTFISAYPPK